MNFEKPTGPMHEAIRKALEEMKLHSNPYGCINLINSVITASNCEPHYQHFLRKAKETDVLDLLPQRATPLTTKTVTARAVSPGSRRNGGEGGGGDAARDARRGQAGVYGGVVHGAGVSPAPPSASPPRTPVFATSRAGVGPTFPSSATAATASQGGTGDGGGVGGKLLHGMLIGASPVRVKGGDQTVAGQKASEAPTRVRPGGPVERDGVIDGSNFNWEGGENYKSVVAGDAAAAEEKKKYTLNVIQLLRLILIRCDAFSQTKQHERAILDAKMAVLIAKRKSPEAYFCCGREERKLYHINESVKCFEAGFAVLRHMKRHVMQGLRAQLLAQGYSEDGTLLERDEVSTKGGGVGSNDDGVSQALEKSLNPNGGGGDEDGGHHMSTSASPIASAFLYQTFSYPDSFVRELERGAGSDDAGAVRQPRHADTGFDSDGEDHWALRGYRPEDVARLGLSKRQEEQRELERLRAFQKLKQRQMRRRQRKRQDSNAAGHAGDGKGAVGLTLTLDPMILDSKSSSRVDLNGMYEQHTDGIADSCDDTESEEDDALVVAPDAQRVSGSHPLPSHSATPRAGGVCVHNSVGSDSLSRATICSASGGGGGGAGAACIATLDDSENDSDAEEDANGDERVFSFFPEVRTRRTKRLTGTEACGGGGVASAGTDAVHHSGTDAHGHPVVVEHHQQSLFRHNNETELLFAMNHYGMSPAELNAWLRLYRESRALKKMSSKKTFPASVFSTTLYLLNRRVVGVRNSIALVFENALLRQVTSVGSGDGKEGSRKAALRWTNLLEFIGCTAPDAQYNANYYFPDVIRQGDVGFAVLQPRGWSGYSGCACFALRVEPSPSPQQAHHQDAVAGGTSNATRTTDHISIFFYFEAPMMGSVKYGVRCVSGIKKDDLRRAFYEINNRKAGIHGIAGAVDEEKGPLAQNGGANNRLRDGKLSSPQGKGVAAAGAAAVSMYEWPRHETAAQRASRLAALKAVRMPASSSWLTSQTLILRTEPTPGPHHHTAAAAAAVATSERRIQISVNNSISSSGTSTAGASGGGAGGGGSGGTVANNNNIIMFSVSERLPVRLKSVELIPALEYAGPAALKKITALSRRYRELVSNFPPTLFFNPAAAGGGGGGGGGAGTHVGGANVPFSALTPLRRNVFAYFPDYCLFSDRFSSPWVIRDKEVIVFKLNFLARVLDQEEYVISVAEDSPSAGITTGLPVSNDSVSGGGGVVNNSWGAATANFSEGLSDGDATATSTAGPQTALPRGAGASANNGLLFFSVDSQSRCNGHVYYADRRCPYFHIRESWMPFSSAIYLQSASASGRTFAAVQSTSSGVLTLSLSTAPRNTEASSLGDGDGTGTPIRAPMAVGIGSGGHAGVTVSGSAVGGGGFGGSFSHTTGGGTKGGSGGGGGGGGGAHGGEPENVLYTVRRRIPPPSGSSIGNSVATGVVRTGTVSPRAAAEGHGSIAAGTVVKSATRLGGAAAVAESAGRPLHGRIASIPSLTQVDAASASTPGSTPAGGNGGLPGRLPIATESSSSIASLTTSHQHHNNNHNATSTPRPSNQRGASGASALAKADHFTVWRSTTHGNGAEIVAEIRVFCSPYPLLKGMQLGEVRLLPGADALLVSTLMVILSRS